jgi:hypothetical protein
MSYHTQGGHANHYTSDAIFERRWWKYVMLMRDISCHVNEGHQLPSDGNKARSLHNIGKL